MSSAPKSQWNFPDQQQPPTLEMDTGMMRAPAVTNYNDLLFHERKDGHPLLQSFKGIIGEIPFCEPNVREGAADWKEDFALRVNGGNSGNSWYKTPLCALVGATGIGTCYLWMNAHLIEQDELGFSINNGRTVVLLPGWHLLSSPMNSFAGKFKLTDAHIHVGTVSIIRVPHGQWGYAMNNSQPEVLLPGLHLRDSPTFKFVESHPLDQELVVFGPIK